MQNEQPFVYNEIMSRTRTVPDDRIFSSIQAMLEQGGEKAVTFGTVAAATGLAASTLVQRYGNLPGMIRAARRAVWDALDQRTTAAITGTADKGAQVLLKLLVGFDVGSLVSDLRDPELRNRALAWRSRLEAALADRFGSGERARESAALLFAAWQGQALWGRDEESRFKLKDAVKRLG